jgi:uroporphyrinogen-III synthase
MRIKREAVRELRRDETKAERIAWSLLRGRRCDGLKFRRQVAIENYVVDFYCFDRRLAVELDGSIHSQPSQHRRDRPKDRFLKRLGVRVLRLPNGLVMQAPEEFVRKTIEAASEATESRRK